MKITGYKVEVCGYVKKMVQASFLVSALVFSQSGPGGVGSTDGKSALKLWLDAEVGVFNDTFALQKTQNGGKVMFWKDLSGSNNHVQATSDSNSPVLAEQLISFNNRSAIRFFKDLNPNCRRNFLVSKKFEKTNDITIYCVFHAVSRAGGNNVTPFQSKEYHPNMWYNGSGLVDAGVEKMVNDVSLAFCDTSIAAGVGDSTTGIDYCIKTPATLFQTYIASMSKEAWSGKLSVNHNLTSPSSMVAGRQPINNSERFFIGSTSDVFTGKTQPFFDGYISTVLVFNKILNEAEKIILENHLSAKYGTTLVMNNFYRMDEPANGDFDFGVIGVGRSFDGSSHLTAQGSSKLELTARNFRNGEFLLMGHNGKELLSEKIDLPEGVSQRTARVWAVSTTLSQTKVDITINENDFPDLKGESFVLLVDTDQDGSFGNERFGKGIIPATVPSSSGRVIFSEVMLEDKSKLTIGTLKSACLSDCENVFSPNGDGVSDTYFISKEGRTRIFDRSGRLVRELQTPAFWDGSTNQSGIANPGLYFLITNEEMHQTVTLVR